MARRTIDTFEATGADAVIVNTSGCGAHMKAYGYLLADDPRMRVRARRFAASVQDLAEFLAQEPLRGPLAAVPLTCTYHDPCHVVHGQKIKSEPRRLLAQIPELRLVELAESDWCCGSAGIYNLTQPEMATRLLHRKVGHVLATGAEAVVTANPGCILQIQAGLAPTAPTSGSCIWSRFSTAPTARIERSLHDEPTRQHPARAQGHRAALGRVLGVDRVRYEDPRDGHERRGDPQLLLEAGHGWSARHRPRRTERRSASHPRGVRARRGQGGHRDGRHRASRRATRPTRRSRRLLDKRLPGFGELFRMLSYQEIGAAAMMSRAQLGIHARRIVVSLPGSPNACRLALEKLVIPELSHLIREVSR